MQDAQCTKAVGSSFAKSPLQCQANGTQLEHVDVSLLADLASQDVLPAPLSGINAGSMLRFRSEDLANVQAQLRAPLNAFARHSAPPRAPPCHNAQARRR